LSKLSPMNGVSCCSIHSYFGTRLRQRPRDAWQDVFARARNREVVKSFHDQLWRYLEAIPPRLPYGNTYFGTSDTHINSTTPTNDIYIISIVTQVTCSLQALGGRPLFFAGLPIAFIASNSRCVEAEEPLIAMGNNLGAFFAGLLTRLSVRSDEGAASEVVFDEVASNLGTLDPEKPNDRDDGGLRLVDVVVVGARSSEGAGCCCCCCRVDERMPRSFFLGGLAMSEVVSRSRTG
jgi:hypothetical protein